ncbi:hypothetical protein NL676_007477 [Syzygium grande]|nr:hypothetical protein NL676_007477 [Syzygium grande]
MSKSRRRLGCTRPPLALPSVHALESRTPRQIRPRQILTARGPRGPRGARKPTAPFSRILSPRASLHVYFQHPVGAPQPLQTVLSWERAERYCWKFTLEDSLMGLGGRGPAWTPGSTPEGPYPGACLGSPVRGPELDQCGQASYARCTLCLWLPATAGVFNFASCSLNSFCPHFALDIDLASEVRRSNRRFSCLYFECVRESSNIIVWIANQ